MHVYCKGMLSLYLKQKEDKGISKVGIAIFRVLAQEVKIALKMSPKEYLPPNELLACFLQSLP